jgi:hypothetical protein
MMQIIYCSSDIESSETTPAYKITRMGEMKHAYGIFDAKTSWRK